MVCMSVSLKCLALSSCLCLFTLRSRWESTVDGETGWLSGGGRIEVGKMYGFHEEKRLCEKAVRWENGGFQSGSFGTKNGSETTAEATTRTLLILTREGWQGPPHSGTFTAGVLDSESDQHRRSVKEEEGCGRVLWALERQP